MSGNSSVQGKIAVVTGASGGIGRATAERLRDEGMALTVAGMRTVEILAGR